MENHWNNWISEADFQRMSAMGVNVVRIPVGWWHIYDQWGGANHAQHYITPNSYVTGGLKYLDRAFDWAARYGMGVILDLHAAPGPQNGNDHSSPSNTHQIYWNKHTDNQNESVDALGLYAERYGNHRAIFAFQALNEPAVDIPTLQNYYINAYNRVRQHTDAVIILNPLISPFQYGTEDSWTNFMNLNQGYTKVWMDLHFYHCFGGMENNSPDTNIIYATYDRKGQLVEYNQKNPKPAIVGEWSNCGVPDYRVGEFMRAQLNSYNEARGWVFWAWNNPWTNNEWSLESVWNADWVQSSDMAARC